MQQQQHESNPFLNSAHPQHQQSNRSFPMLPSPMQLFSSVTTVQVEHSPSSAAAAAGPLPPADSGLLEHDEIERSPPLQQRQQTQQGQAEHFGPVAVPGVLPRNLMHPKEAVYTRTTSAKKISTNEFRVSSNGYFMCLNIILLSYQLLKKEVKKIELAKSALDSIPLLPD